MIGKKLRELQGLPDVDWAAGRLGPSRIDGNGDNRYFFYQS